MELSNEFTVSLPPDEAFAVLTDVNRIAPCMPGAELQEVRGEEYLGVVKVKVGPITAQYKGVARFLEKDVAARRAVLRAEGRDTRGQGNANATITATLEPAGAGTKVAVSTDLTVTGKVAQFGRGVLADVSAKLLNQFVDCLEATIAAGTAGEPASGAAGEPAAEAAGAAAAGVDGEPAAAVAGAATAGMPRPETGAGAGKSGAGRASADPNPVPDAAGPATSPASSAGAPGPATRSAEPVDLLAVAGSPLLKRLVPVAALLAGAVALVAAVRARLRRRRSGARR